MGEVPIDKTLPCTGKQAAATSLVCAGGGAGSSSGQKRKSTGRDEHNDDHDDDPPWRLSLGSIYDGASAASSSPALARESACISVAQAPLPVLRHPAAAAATTSPAAANLGPPHAPPVPAGAAFLASATGVLAQAQIASSPSLFSDGNGGAPTPNQFASIPVSSPRILVAAPSAVSSPFPVKHVVAMAAASLPRVKQDVESRPPVPARPTHRSTRRRNNGAPDHPTGGGGPPGDSVHVNGNESPVANDGVITNPPFPWATGRVAIHHSIDELSKRGIKTVEGEVQCRRCDARKVISYDVAAKFNEVREFVSRNIVDMDDRAPQAWTSPALPDCDGCGQRNSLRPVIPAEKEKINWVFLLLGQTLGLCTLGQLKHFCAHTKQHRTGAKDRVLYSTYMELCNQLCPDKLFNVTAERQKRSQQYS